MRTVTGHPAWPGVLLGLAVAGLAVLVAGWVPSVSPLLVAILLGVLMANTVTLPERIGPGLDVCAKLLLRWGIVLLGLRISLDAVVDLGWKVVLLAVLVVAVGMGTAWVVGGMLRLPPAQRLLIGAGFSICGAAAVAAVEDGLDEHDPADVLTAVALVVLFGTGMILVVPVGAALLALTPEVAGVWAGASIHEVAQVVAAGGIIGAAALQVAVVVKLIRVLMLAPVVIGVSVLTRMRSRGRDGAEDCVGAPHRSRPPLVPWFALAFVAMVVVRSTAPVPDAVLATGHVLEAVLLSAAMFALGCGVHRGVLRGITGGALALALVLTGVVGAVGLAGALLAL